MTLQENNLTDTHIMIASDNQIMIASDNQIMIASDTHIMIASDLFNEVPYEKTSNISVM